MSELASFLPRHFAAPPQASKLPLSSQAATSASMDCPSLPHSFTPSSSLLPMSASSASSQQWRRDSVSGFSSTASDCSSSDSPCAGLSSASSGSASPSPPANSRQFFPVKPSMTLSLPAFLPSHSGNPSLAALLPSAPDLKRQLSQPPSSSASSQPTGSQPSAGGKMLWINTERPAEARPAVKSNTNLSLPLPSVPSFTPPSSPVGSSSPLTASDFPAVHAMRLNVSPASSPLSASFTASAAVPQPRSPAAHLRHVPLVTPPTSPSQSHEDAMAPLPDLPTSSSGTDSCTSPPATCLSLPQSLALSFAAESSLPELLASISMVIHVQLIKDEQASDEAKNKLPAFRELPSASSPNSAAVCPSVRSIYQFLLHVFQRGRFQSELALLSLVYVHRAMASSRVALTPANFRPLFIASLCLANKMWDDTPLINADFRILYPQLLGCSSAHALSKLQYLAVFNRLETQLCAAIDWNLAVSTDTFHLYLHELQAIWTEYEHGLHTQQGAATVPAPQTVQAQAGKGVGKASVHSHRHHPYAVSSRRSKERAAADRSDSKYDSDGGEMNGWPQSAHPQSPMYQSAPIPLQQQAVPVL